MPVPTAHGPGLDGGAEVERAWSALLWAADRVRRKASPADGFACGFRDGRMSPVAAADPSALLVWRKPEGWSRAATAPAAVHALLDLYLPVCNSGGRSSLTVGHLGQGLDGHIATSGGDSFYVTGPENLLHLHRMRALCDAVVVGAGTVAADNPQLTARRAAGTNPVRVILDPNRRLSAEHGVFCDEQAATLLVCNNARLSNDAERIGSAEVLGIPFRAGRFQLEALMAALHARRLNAVFVEGGGYTVSAFLEAGLLDRLQVAIAPLLIGAGRPGIRLVGSPRLTDCLRPPHRIFAMGQDVLFDCDLRAHDDTDAERPQRGRLSRVF